MLTKLKEIDALGLPATCRFRARVQGDARGPSSTSLKIRQRFQKHLAVALTIGGVRTILATIVVLPFICVDVG
jgi:hypothetical protein